MSSIILVQLVILDPTVLQGDAYSVTSRQTVPNKKSIDDISLIPSISKALVLAGSQLPHIVQYIFNLRGYVRRSHLLLHVAGSRISPAVFAIGTNS